jgi:hypothetical protein
VFELQPVHVYLITLFLSVPILGMLTGLLKEWLVLRAKQAAPGKVRDVEQKLEKLMDRAGLQIKNLERVKQDLEGKLEKLEKENADYAERLENLESIVVSQAWEALHQPRPAGEAHKPRPAEPDGAVVPTRPHEVSELSVEDRNRQRAADLARRAGR